MLNVAIFGGAFDPVTRGHIEIVEYLSPSFDQVWFLPCFDHTFGKKMTHVDFRLDMCQLASSRFPNVKTCNYEVARQIVGGTYEVLRSLMDEPYCKNVRFHFVIGQDNADHADKWVRWSDLEELVPFVVMPRKGYPLCTDPNAWYRKNPHTYASKFKSREISSTEVRKMLAEDDAEAEEHLDPAVFKYIHHHGLYIRPEKRFFPNILVRVEELSSHNLQVVVPSWHPTTTVQISRRALPKGLGPKLKRGVFLYADVNIGTTCPEELEFRNFQDVMRNNDGTYFQPKKVVTTEKLLTEVEYDSEKVEIQEGQV